jgi:hypothetical protein
MFVSKEQWGNALQQVGAGIKYTNFKSHISKVQGYQRSRLYGKVWGVMHGLIKRAQAQAARLPL